MYDISFDLVKVFSCVDICVERKRKKRKKIGSEQRERAHGCTDVINIATCDTLELLLSCGFRQEEEEVEKVASNTHPFVLIITHFFFNWLKWKKNHRHDLAHDSFLDLVKNWLLAMLSWHKLFSFVFYFHEIARSTICVCMLVCAFVWISQQNRTSTDMFHRSLRFTVNLNATHNTQGSLSLHFHYSFRFLFSDFFFLQSFETYFT